MNDTGGTLEDYVKINQDYSNTDDSTLLYQYYNQTKNFKSFNAIKDCLNSGGRLPR